jgi:predicted RNase H-like nuclease (RuvC/YqgF family)
MKKYICYRCGYKSIQKNDVKKHLNKKKSCDPIFMDVSIEEALNLLNEKDKDVLNETVIKQLEDKNKEMKNSKELIQIKHQLIQIKQQLEESYKEKENLKKELEESYKEIDKLKKPNTEDLDENIYLIQTRSCVDKNENVYKLGRTNNLKLRFNQYCKGGVIKLTYPCINSKDIEKELLILFNKQFKQRLDYGNEYFQGDLKQMTKQINGYFYIKIE